MPQQLNPRASWPSNDDQTVFNLIVIAIGLGLGSYLLWTYFHGQISAGVVGWRHAEIQLLRHFTSRFDHADAQMMQANPYSVTLRSLYGISHALGKFWRPPACGFIVVLAFVCMARAAASQFKRSFDLDSLAGEQAATFSSTLAFVGRKLRLTRPRQGDPRPADYALTAEEWIERHALNAEGRLDEVRARAALVRQLGARWKGPETAAPVVKVLFVAFALHLSERRQDALDLLGAVSAALRGVAINHADGPETAISVPAEIVAQAFAMVADPLAFEEARRVTDGHAFAAPALMTLLTRARSRHGVLAPAQFAWLKLLDRPLWYALHSLGFETEGVGRYLHPNPRVEAIGARDHWAVERAAGQSVHEPDLSRALAVLRQHAPAERASARPDLVECDVTSELLGAADHFSQRHSRSARPG
jgi:intracellular multiplication protein IcmP